MAVRIEQRYSPEEYLALEHRAEHKSEYIDGRIVAMSGASRRHDRIAGNVFAGLHQRLRGRPCEVFTSDMRVRTGTGTLYTYPDVSALCGEARFEEAETDTLLNPTVIVEVLSESTEAYDRGRKFLRYRQTESVREYVLIAQDEAHVDHYVRQGDVWVLSAISDLDGALELTALGCDLPMREIYERVAFSGDTV